MKKAIAHLVGQAPIIQSRYHSHEPESEKFPQESHDAFEKRTWKNKAHYSPEGFIQIPPMALKNALVDGCKYRKRKGPSGGQSTWTKNFEGGVLVASPITFPISKEDIEYWGAMVASDGKKGKAGGSKVFKLFPRIPEGWEGDAEFTLIDDAITPAIFEEVLTDTGLFIGLGSFRVQMGGVFGRFSVGKVTYEEI